MKIYRFEFPAISKGLKRYRIPTLNVMAKNKKRAKKVAIDFLKKNIGVAIEAIAPETAVRIATITSRKWNPKDVEILMEVRCDPKK